MKIFSAIVDVIDYLKPETSVNLQFTPAHQIATHIISLANSVGIPSNTLREKANRMRDYDLVMGPVKDPRDRNPQADDIEEQMIVFIGKLDKLAMYILKKYIDLPVVLTNPIVSR